MKFLIAPLTLAIIFLAFACHEEMPICSADIVTLTIEVKDQNSHPIILDSHYILDEEQNAITIEEFDHPWDSIYRHEGKYFLFSDNQYSKTNNKGKKFTFLGIKENKLLVKESFTIGKDECHVKLVKGETSIVIPNQM